MTFIGILLAAFLFGCGGGGGGGNDFEDDDSFDRGELAGQYIAQMDNIACLPRDQIFEAGTDESRAQDSDYLFIPPAYEDYDLTFGGEEWIAYFDGYSYFQETGGGGPTSISYYISFSDGIIQANFGNDAIGECQGTVFGSFAPL